MKRMIAMILAVILAVGLLSGCENKTKTPDASAEAEPVSTGAHFDLTRLFTDTAAFDAAYQRVDSALLPAYEQLANDLSDTEKIRTWLGSYDEIYAAVARLNVYTECAYYLDGGNEDAIAQYNAVRTLEQKFTLLTASAEKALCERGDAFFAELFSSERLQP